MARSFDGSSYLRDTSPTVTALPLTIAAWVRHTVAPSAAETVATVVHDSSGQRLELRLSNTGAVFALDVGSTATRTATAGTVVTNTWHHLAGVFTSATSRQAYLDGVAGSENTADSGGLTNTPDFFTMGALLTSGSGSAFLTGEVASLGVWSAALSAAEVASLAAGFSPAFVRRGSLESLFEMQRGSGEAENDFYGGGTAATQGVGTVGRAAHPRIFYPASGRAGKASAATVAPRAMHHYRQLRAG